MTGQASKQCGELPVIWEVMDRHLEEAGMLWSTWEQALVAPDRTLAELAATDEERLLAHLEGLVVGGAAVARERLLPSLVDELDAELVFTGALALLSGAEAGSHVGMVLEALAAAQGDLRAAMVRALQLAPLADAAACLTPAMTHSEPAARAAALQALAFRRIEVSPQLPALLEDDDAGVRTAALVAARGPVGTAVLPAVARALDDPSPRVRWAALEAGLIHGLEPARNRCRGLATESGQDAALLLLSLFDGAAAREHLLAALAREEDRDAALVALGYLGLPEAIPHILPHLEGPAHHARLAGEAIFGVTGLDLSAPGMTLPPDDPEPDEPVPLEDEDLDADLVPSPVDLLPVPDAAAVARWWDENRERFSQRQRLVAGMPMSAEAIRAALLRGPMRRRPALALNLAILTRGRILPETRTWARVQLAQLNEASWPAG